MVSTPELTKFINDLLADRINIKDYIQEDVILQDYTHWQKTDRAKLLPTHMLGDVRRVYTPLMLNQVLVGITEVSKCYTLFNALAQYYFLHHNYDNIYATMGWTYMYKALDQHCECLKTAKNITNGEAKNKLAPYRDVWNDAKLHILCMRGIHEMIETNNVLSFEYNKEFSYLINEKKVGGERNSNNVLYRLYSSMKELMRVTWNMNNTNINTTEKTILIRDMKVVMNCLTAHETNEILLMVRQNPDTKIPEFSNEFNLLPNYWILVLDQTITNMFQRIIAYYQQVLLDPSTPKMNVDFYTIYIDALKTASTQKNSSTTITSEDEKKVDEKKEVDVVTIPAENNNPPPISDLLQQPNQEHPVVQPSAVNDDVDWCQSIFHVMEKAKMEFSQLRIENQQLKERNEMLQQRWENFRTLLLNQLETV